MKDGKYEVGDRVRVVGTLEHMHFQNGDVGIVDFVGENDARVNFNRQNNKTVNGAGMWWVFLSCLELASGTDNQQPAVLPVTPEVKPSKPTRVRAYKEDYIQRATLAEMRVHQLDVDLNKAVDEAVDLRAANELAVKELVRLTDQLNGQRADFLTQKTLANRYKELYDGLTVWQAIKRAARKAVHHA